ncbi:MAG: hypothetical protein ACI87W_000493 [Halieaceae bacterium]|jgi:hypothetical protein
MDDKDREDSPANTPERSEHETILLALDQISQTIDVMNSVVGRLRNFVQKQPLAPESEIRDAMRPGRTLH